MYVWSLDTLQQFTTRLWFPRVRNFEKDLIFSMTSFIDTEVALARPGKAVHADETRRKVSVVLPDTGESDVVDRVMTDSGSSSWRHSRLRRVNDRFVLWS